MKVQLMQMYKKRLNVQLIIFFILLPTLLYMVCCVFQATNLVNNYQQRKSARTFLSRQEASNKLYTAYTVFLFNLLNIYYICQALGVFYIRIERVPLNLIWLTLS
jgi:uncharacterized membrane protein